MITKNKDLTQLNTLHVQAKTQFFADVTTKEELREAISEGQNRSVFVLGGGSNVLFVDDFGGLIIHPQIKGKKVIDEDSNNVWLKVGAGENWHQLVRFCVERGWGGIENLSLIPGWAGAAPIQNIGAYGVEFKDVFHSLTAIEIQTGREKIFNKEQCKFGYRDSIFKQELKNKFVITDATIKLDKYPKVNTSYGSIRNKLDAKNIDNPTIKDISDIVTEIRKNKLPDPDSIPNAGSFFKNPILEEAAFAPIREKFPEIPHYPMNENKTKIP
ncbi:MAG TPA: UDP-N-acetylmuramate dehydrogenase, partial [Balneolaceae bacterium]|nr:UDP-N-acetylmuramate dehydrogenase [Balneolaceae bacterium]